jgi:hypothetical protein
LRMTSTVFNTSKPSRTVTVHPAEII